MKGVVGLNAMLVRMSLRANEVITLDNLILDVFPKYSVIKREDLLRTFFGKYGTVYDNDDTRILVSKCLREMCKSGVIVRVSPGLYRRNLVNCG